MIRPELGTLWNDRGPALALFRDAAVGELRFALCVKSAEELSEVLLADFSSSPPIVPPI
jgi:hypothetical protein